MKHDCISSYWEVVKPVGSHPARRLYPLWYNKFQIGLMEDGITAKEWRQHKLSSTVSK